MVNKPFQIYNISLYRNSTKEFLYMLDIHSSMINIELEIPLVSVLNFCIIDVLEIKF